MRVTEAFSFLSPSLSPLLAATDTFPSHVWTNCYSSCVAEGSAPSLPHPPPKGPPGCPAPALCRAILSFTRAAGSIGIALCMAAFTQKIGRSLCAGDAQGVFWVSFSCRGKSQFLHCHCPQPHGTPQCWAEGLRQVTEPSSSKWGAHGTLEHPPGPS